MGPRRRRCYPEAEEAWGLVECSAARSGGTGKSRRWHTGNKTHDRSSGSGREVVTSQGRWPETPMVVDWPMRLYGHRPQYRHCYCNGERQRELIAAGAAGCFLEDQVWPKKCGHMRGKRVIDRDDYIRKIRAAVEARKDRDFFIVARTDALAVAGLDEAIVRVEAARKAGADASFVEAPASREDLQAIGRRSPPPNVANMIEGGRTPVLPQQELAALGFQLILYPLTGLFAAARAMEAMYRTLKDNGTTLGGEGRLMTFAEFNGLIGVEEKYALAERYGADS